MEETPYVNSKEHGKVVLGTTGTGRSLVIIPYVEGKRHINFLRLIKVREERNRLEKQQKVSGKFNPPRHSISLGASKMAHVLDGLGYVG